MRFIEMKVTISSIEVEVIVANVGIGNPVLAFRPGSKEVSVSGRELGLIVTIAARSLSS